jgi:hypothetical protein
MLGFQFKEQGHIYTLDGSRLPSVTEILTSEGFINNGFYTKYGRERGQAVHLACHLDDMNDLDDSSIDPVIEPYLFGYRQFKKDTHFKVIRSEFKMYHSIYNFAGTPDKDGILHDKPSLLDIKTGSVEPWTGLQLAAYDILLQEYFQKENVPSHESRNRKRVALQLNDDGTYKLYPFDDRSDMSVFLSAVCCYHWKRNNGRKG